MAAPTLRTPTVLIPVWDNRGMTARFKILSLLLIGVAGGGGIAAALLWPPRQPAMELASGTLFTPSQALPDFSLIDTQGRSFGPANLRGHWSMMFFGYTNCPDFCPATLSTLAALQKRLRAQHATLPQVIFVSVDAKRDTPEQLAKYVPYFDPDFIGLTAVDQLAIEAVAKRWGVLVSVHPAKDGNYTVDHSSAIFVLDPAGRLAAVLSGPFTVSALQSDLRRIVTGRA
jgi:protein SCO1/2